MTHAISTIEKTATPSDLRWNLLQKKAQEYRAVQAFRLFREHDIEPILIKGLSAGRFYPADRPRISIDLDLAVSRSDFGAAFKLASSPEAAGLAIDLHEELRHHDTLDWADLFANSDELEFDEGSIRVLRPEDSLRVLCIHWLTDGGSNRDRLWDIVYCVQNRPQGFEWSRFLDPVDRNRRRWLTVTLGLAHHYHGLDLAGTPVEKDSRNIPEWVLQTVDREWAARYKAEPLENVIYRPRDLAIQLAKRLRPNPIWATIQMNGSFDARTRVFYQFGNALSRVLPTLRRIRDTVAAERSR